VLRVKTLPQKSIVRKNERFLFSRSDRRRGR
jgi:hypothetical protein